MRNSGGSTDNNGYRGKKIDPGQILTDTDRSWSASAAGSTSPLRGADVIDAEFVHIDDHGNPRQASKPARQSGFQSVRADPVDFDDDRSAHFRRLGLFSGDSLPLNRRRMLPLLGCALVVALGAGGVWFSGDRLGDSTPVEPPRSIRSTAADVVTGSISTGDVALSHDATGRDIAPAVDTNADGSAVQRSEGSLIYFNSPKPAPVTGNANRSRVSGSQPVRGYRDLTISLAGGSSGR